MSNVNIQRAVENIRSGTNVYTPLVEVIVNAIHAIKATGQDNGVVEIRVIRASQAELDDSSSDITGFEVSDNGVGFTQEHRTAFDTLYTTQKLSEGGKGFGRLTCLKYFREVKIDSVFAEDGTFLRRSFRMGKGTEFIVDEEVEPARNGNTGSRVSLVSIKQPFPDKGLSTVARGLVEKLLPFFIEASRESPQILLKEKEGADTIVLNEYIGGVENPYIMEVPRAGGEFTLESNDGEETFRARVFKLYSPKAKRSKISLVAHRREVTWTSLHNYIPEFSEEFFEDIRIDGVESPRNFIVAVYVVGDYLDANVSVERGGFEFQQESDLLSGIAEKDIESKASDFARAAVASEVQHRQERKAERVGVYVRDDAPWHRAIAQEADLSALPYRATDDEIDAFLHRLKHIREREAQNEVSKLLASESAQEVEENAASIVKVISESSRSELVHYIALRRSVLDILQRTLELDEDGQYRSEGAVHDIIFPRKGDTDHTRFEDHNLWIIDERLNFTEFVASDVPLSRGNADRPDLLGFGRRIGFRGENDPSNPVTIFEFKRPQRDDFVNPSSKEDPVEQIIRYVRQIRAGNFRTPQGREILVSDNTPFYGYVVCDLTPKVRTWIQEEKDFKPMPDALGFFRWHGSLNLYMEALGWDKVVKDANQRSRIFFHKLSI